MSRKRSLQTKQCDLLPWKQIQVERQRICSELAREFCGFTLGALVQELVAYWAAVTEEMDSYRRSLDIVSPQAERFHAAAAELEVRHDPSLIPVFVKWLALADRRRQSFAVITLRHYSTQQFLGKEQSNVANALLKFLKGSLTNHEVVSDCIAALEAIAAIDDRLALESIQLVLTNAESCAGSLVRAAVICKDELAENSYQLEDDHRNALAWVESALSSEAAPDSP